MQPTSDVRKTGGAVEEAEPQDVELDEARERLRAGAARARRARLGRARPRPAAWCSGSASSR